MRIVFLGTPEAAVPSLVALADAGHQVPLAVTRPDKPAGRSRQPQAPALKRAALGHGIRVEQPAAVRDAAFRELVLASEPELLVVVAYGRILPPEILDLPRLGAINVHFSLLPKYRGAAPVQWALVRGEHNTGVTTMQMSERLDEGGVLLQRELPIEHGEHAPELERRLARLGAEVLLETVARLGAGSLTPRPQVESGATLAPRLSAADGEVDLRLTARELEGRVRGFDPWPGVWVRRQRKRMRIVEARALEGRSASGPPGRVLELRPEGLVLACGDGSLLLVARVQIEGRRSMPAADAVHGRQILPGDQLEQASRPG